MSSSFTFENVDVSIVNAIRRIILAEVKNVAIVNDMDFEINTSPLHNEFLAHRISLIPLHFDSEEIEKFKAEEYCFLLKVKNDTTNISSVTTAEIKVLNEDGEEYPKNIRDKIFPPCKITKDHILIIKLKPGEEVSVKFRAAKDIAKSHARWSPVSKCTFINVIDENLVAEKRRDIKKEDLHKFETIDKYRLYKKNAFGEPSEFKMSIDSECRLTPEYLLEKSIQILQKKTRRVPEKMTFTTIDESQFLYSIIVDKEDHTIGNVLQSYIYNKYVRTENGVAFVGYYQPHPLEHKIMMKIKFSLKQNVEDFMKNVTKELSNEPVHYFLNEK